MIWCPDGISRVLVRGRRGGREMGWYKEGERGTEEREEGRREGGWEGGGKGGRE